MFETNWMKLFKSQDYLILAGCRSSCRQWLILVTVGTDPRFVGWKCTKVTAAAYLEYWKFGQNCSKNSRNQNLVGNAESQYPCGECRITISLWGMENYSVLVGNAESQYPCGECRITVSCGECRITISLWGMENYSVLVGNAESQYLAGNAESQCPCGECKITMSLWGMQKYSVRRLHCK